MGLNPLYGALDRVKTHVDRRLTQDCNQEIAKWLGYLASEGKLLDYGQVTEASVSSLTDEQHLNSSIKQVTEVYRIMNTPRELAVYKDLGQQYRQILTNRLEPHYSSSELRQILHRANREARIWIQKHYFDVYECSANHSVDKTQKIRQERPSSLHRAINPDYLAGVKAKIAKKGKAHVTQQMADVYRGLMTIGAPRKIPISNVRSAGESYLFFLKNADFDDIYEL